MDIFTFSKEAIKTQAIKQVISIYPLIILVLFGGFVIANHLEDNEMMEDPAFLLIMAGVLLFILIGGYFSSIKAISKVMLETEFVLTESSIEKHIPNGKNTEIIFRDVRNVHHSKKGILIKSQNEQILIPNQLTDFEEIEAVIKSKTKADLYSIGTKYKMNEIVMKYVVGVSFMAILMSFFLVEDKQVKLLIGGSILLLFIYAIYDEFKNNHASNISASKLATIAMIIVSLIIHIVYISFYL